MRLISLDLLAISLTIPLTPPQTRRGAHLDEFAAWLGDSEHGLGLRPEQVRLKSWDELFGYELVAQFFGENGHLFRTADGIKLTIRNCRTRGDWEIVRKTLVRFYQHMDFAPKSITTVTVHVHSRLPTLDELEAFFQQFPQPAMASRPALLGYVKIDDWETEVRLLIEKSNALPDALFLAWDTTFANSQDWETFIGTLPTVMENAAHVFDLAFNPMA